MDDLITITGNLASEPESRGTGAVAITSFRIASTQRKYDREAGRWVDGHVNWYNVSTFRQLATHALASFHKGQRVIVTGKLKIRDWETATGRGTSVDIEADSVGHDLQWGASEFRRAAPGDAGRSQPAATEWNVTAPAEDNSDSWNPPMTADPGATSTLTEQQVVTAPAREPAYAGEEAPF